MTTTREIELHTRFARAYQERTALPLHASLRLTARSREQETFSALLEKYGQTLLQTRCAFGHQETGASKALHVEAVATMADEFYTTHAPYNGKPVAGLEAYLANRINQIALDSLNASEPIRPAPAPYVYTPKVDAPKVSEPARISLWGDYSIPRLTHDRAEELHSKYNPSARYLNDPLAWIAAAEFYALQEQERGTLTDKEWGIAESAHSFFARFHRVGDWVQFRRNQLEPHASAPTSQRRTATSNRKAQRPRSFSV